NIAAGSSAAGSSRSRAASRGAARGGSAWDTSAHGAAGVGSRRSFQRVLPDIFFHPIQVALRYVENEFGLLEAMWLARVDHHSGGHAARFERVVILVALRGRNARVRFAVDDERRCGD